jgi:2-amino-4-hydroxy-6-hydroxymethyldihydropteridine diphosphokinase
MKRVYLSLGSNLGDRVGRIRQALRKLAEAGLEVRRVSSLYRTEPVDYLPQPWFVNCAAQVTTELLPLRLLSVLQAVERSLGRRPGIPKGPRAIDIDILLYENAVVRSARLTLPHPRMAERRFVLIPLRELDPCLRDPVSRRTVVEMLRETADQSQVVKIKPEFRTVDSE